MEGLVQREKAINRFRKPCRTERIITPDPMRSSIRDSGNDPELSERDRIH
jgi:hypothetical protein